MPDLAETETTSTALPKKKKEHPNAKADADANIHSRQNIPVALMFVVTRSTLPLTSCVGLVHFVGCWMIPPSGRKNQRASLFSLSIRPSLSFFLSLPGDHPLMGLLQWQAISPMVATTGVGGAAGDDAKHFHLEISLMQWYMLQSLSLIE